VFNVLPSDLVRCYPWQNGFLPVNETAAKYRSSVNSRMPPIKPFSFIGLCSVSFVLIVWLPESVFVPFNHATAYLAGLCLTFFGEHPETAGAMISLGGFRVRIITECTPLYSLVLFGVLVCSVPVGLRTRLAGLLAVMPLLVAANTLRIALVTIVGAAHPALFEAVHVYLAQIVMLLLVIAASLVWIHWATGPGQGEGPFLLRALALASIIFLPWLILNEAYVKALDLLITGVFALADYRLEIPYGNLVYFQTFNTVIYLALILAEKWLSIKARIAWASAGVLILAAGHVLFRIGNVLLTAFSWHPALPLTIFLNLFGEYLLPVILWVAAVKGRQYQKEPES
jgi:exosortase H (IPTLxxWG-CTERM-specific)